jgi:hypothetical protein
MEAAVVKERITKHSLGDNGDVTQQESYQKRRCHALRLQTNSATAVEHVVPHHTHQQRNVFCRVRRETIWRIETRVWDKEVGRISTPQPRES